MSARHASTLSALWYRDGLASTLLVPLGWLFSGGVELRRIAYRLGMLRSHRISPPVVVVGNITAGGAGKTPFTMWLARALAERGWRPGIACRGYGGHARHWPQQVRPDSDPMMVGDEAVMMARRTGVPVAAAPDRVAAATALASVRGCDVVICDDGLQHLALARDIEVVLVDGARRLGNGHCQPAGPLREHRGRLRHCDFVVVKAPARGDEIEMRLCADRAVNLANRDLSRPLADWRATPVHAVAGIGNPDNFFATLADHGLEVLAHRFPDHHPFTRADIEFADGHPVLMTEKDAVKCERFADARHWWVPVEAHLPEPFTHRLLERIAALGAVDPRHAATGGAT